MLLSKVRSSYTLRTGGAVVASRCADDRQSTTRRARVRSSSKLECSAGPVCFDNLGVSEGPATVAFRPVGEVVARSEPSLLRLLDTDKSGQLSRARDRLSSFCKKLRRTISECPSYISWMFNTFVICPKYHPTTFSITCVFHCNVLMLLLCFAATSRRRGNS